LSEGEGRHSLPSVYNSNIGARPRSMTSQSISSTPTLIRLCNATDIALGNALRVEHGGLAFAVYNVDGEYFVTDDACTHGPGSLSEGDLKSDIIECNFHGGQFNVRTGEVVGPPCMLPVKTYKVRLAGGSIFIEL
jgi:biphenyl 2,3-dioxygenase ferredoxin component